MQKEGLSKLKAFLLISSWQGEDDIYTHQKYTGIELIINRINIHFVMDGIIVNRFDDGERCMVFLRDHLKIFMGGYEAHKIIEKHKEEERQILSQQQNNDLAEVLAYQAQLRAAHLQNMVLGNGSGISKMSGTAGNLSLIHI